MNWRSQEEIRAETNKLIVKCTLLRKHWNLVYTTLELPTSIQRPTHDQFIQASDILNKRKLK